VISDFSETDLGFYIKKTFVVLEFQQGTISSDQLDGKMAIPRTNDQGTQVPSCDYKPQFEI